MKLMRSAAVLFFAMLSIVASARSESSGQSSQGRANAATSNPFDSFIAFSATLNGGIGQDRDRKIYRSGNLMRLDFAESYRITDLSKLTTWGVDPHSCSQFAMPDAGTFPFSAYRDFKIERSMTAEKETIDGHICRIENVRFTPTDGRPLIVRMKLWEAEDLQRFPIKVEVEPTDPAGKPLSKVTVEYSNVSLERPDPKLFHHPAKCLVGMGPADKGIKPNHPEPQQLNKR